MIAFIQENYTALLCMMIVVAIALLIFCIVKKFIKLAIAILILSVVAPVLFTIFWGDGTSYVEKFSSYLSPQYQQGVEDAYAYYKEKDAEQPVIDYEAFDKLIDTEKFDYPIPSSGGISDEITDVFDYAKKAAGSLLNDTDDSKNQASQPSESGG